MGRIVFAGAMSHVLDPDYYDRACGAVGRQKVAAVMAEIARMGERLSAATARRSDRRGRRPPQRVLVQLRAGDLRAHRPHACSAWRRTTPRPSTRCSITCRIEYPLHEELANEILEQGVAAGFDLALSWEAPVDHAFLSPVNTMHGTRPIPPLVPIFVNAFVAPQPTARRCFAFGQHIARVVAAEPMERGDHRHRRAVALPRALAAARGRDRHRLRPQAHPLDGGGRARAAAGARPRTSCTRAGEHEFLNWMVLLGAVTPARAAVRYFGELPRINLAAVEWSLP